MSDESYVTSLIEKLSAKTSRYEAAETLINLGSTAVEPLISALRHESRDIRGNAAWTLGCIGDPRAVEPLIGELNDEAQENRLSASIALVKIGAPAVESLISALKGNNAGVKKLASSALSMIYRQEKLDERRRKMIVSTLGAVAQA